VSQSWLKLCEVAERFKVRRQTIRGWIDSGRFPAPVTLPGGRQVRFDEREVAKFERELLAARRAA
jgi:excisionase family DNA binding protein